MRTAIMMVLVVLGLLMLPSPYLPLGLVMMWLGWWVYERSPAVGDEQFIGALMALGGLGAVAVVVFAATGWVTAPP